jgi:hypothetical protein
MVTIKVLARGIDRTAGSDTFRKWMFVLGLAPGWADPHLASKMRQRRSKNAFTLQFEQHDYLQTIIEGEPINIRTLPSLKLSLLADRPSHDDDEDDTKENSSDALVLTSREVEDSKANNDLEEPSESKLASDVNHGKEISTSAQTVAISLLHLATLLTKHRLGNFAHGMQSDRPERRAKSAT